MFVALLGIMWVACAKKLALHPSFLPRCAKKFALRAQNGRKTLFSGVLGEFFRGNAAGGVALGEYFRAAGMAAGPFYWQHSPA